MRKFLIIIFIVVVPKMVFCQSLTGEAIKQKIQSLQENIKSIQDRDNDCQSRISQDIFDIAEQNSEIQDLIKDPDAQKPIQNDSSLGVLVNSIQSNPVVKDSNNFR